MKPKTIKIIGIVLTVIASLMIGIGGIAILAGVEGATKHLVAMGVGNYLKLLGAMHIIFVLLFAYPKTMKLGFILLCCYFGGAIAVELSWRQKLDAIVPITIVWVAALFRDRSIFITKEQTTITNQ